MLDIVISCLLGVSAGTFTGLFPGIHINLISSLITLNIATLIPLSYFSPISLVIFIVSMSITHTFIDFIPSIFLGAPEEDTFLSILPGHEMLKEGRGQEAAIITLYGSLAAIPTILIFTPIFIKFLPVFYSTIKSSMPFILIFISLFIILREKSFVKSILIFILSGFIGLIAFNLPVKEPLMPLLTGMFGLSSLLLSYKDNSKIKKQIIQNIRNIKLKKEEIRRATFSSLIASPLCSFLPGIGSGHAAVIGSEILPQTRKSFLFLVGSLNTVIMSLSFVTAYSIEKARTGSAVAVLEILKEISIQDLKTIMITVLISSIIAFLIGLKITNLFAKNINKINYNKLTLIVCIILIAVNLIFSNWIGFIVLLTSSALGIFCILSNSKRINLMGALIIPSIIYLLY